MSQGDGLQRPVHHPTQWTVATLAPGYDPVVTRFYLEADAKTYHEDLRQRGSSHAFLIPPGGFKCPAW